MENLRCSGTALDLYSLNVKNRNYTWHFLRSRLGFIYEIRDKAGEPIRTEKEQCKQHCTHSRGQLGAATQHGDFGSHDRRRMDYFVCSLYLTRASAVLSRFNLRCYQTEAGRRMVVMRKHTILNDGDKSE